MNIFSDTKTCGACRRTLPLYMFYANRSRSDGLQWHCRECSAKASRAYRQRNPEKVKARQREFREKLRKRKEAATAAKETRREQLPAHLRDLPEFLWDHVIDQYASSAKD